MKKAAFYLMALMDGGTFARAVAVTNQSDSMPGSALKDTINS
jgi:hypothetical protein